MPTACRRDLPRPGLLRFTELRFIWLISKQFRFGAETNWLSRLMAKTEASGLESKFLLFVVTGVLLNLLDLTLLTF